MSTAHASTESTAGGESEGGGVKGGWLSTVAHKGGDWAKEKAKDKLKETAKDKAKEAVFGKPAESPSQGPSSTLMRPPVSYGPPSSGSDAYGWTRATCQSFPALNPAQTPDRSGLGGWLDHNVKAVLEHVHAMDLLEKVTGNLGELNAASEEWHAQAVAVANVADQLRAEASSLPEQWQGSASDAFGRHMGTVVEALDATAGEMYQTAQIINQAAQVCAMAEGMVIQIISEMIESLIASLAAEAVLAVLTLGIGAIVGALVDAAEVGVFLERIGKVSLDLEKALKELLEALKELNTARKEMKSIKDIKNLYSKFKDVKKAASALRKMEEGDSAFKILKDAKEAKSLDGVGKKLGGYAAREAAKYADSKATDWAQGEFKQHLLGDKDDPVSTFNPADLKGGKGHVWENTKTVLGGVGGSITGTVKGAWQDPTDKSLITGAVEGEIGSDGIGKSIAGSGFVQGAEHYAGDLPFGLGDKLEGAVTGNEYVKGVTENESDPAPYRVDKSRIENAFG